MGWGRDFFFFFVLTFLESLFPSIEQNWDFPAPCWGISVSESNPDWVGPVSCAPHHPGSGLGQCPACCVTLFLSCILTKSVCFLENVGVYLELLVPLVWLEVSLWESGLLFLEYLSLSHLLCPEDTQRAACHGAVWEALRSVNSPYLIEDSFGSRCHCGLWLSSSSHQSVSIRVLSTALFLSSLCKTH
jgi:hypothetical protein